MGSDAFGKGCSLLQHINQDTNNINNAVSKIYVDIRSQSVFMQHHNPQLKVHGALLTVSLIYGLNYSIAKIAMLESIPPFAFIFVRILGATVLFWLIGMFQKSEDIRYKRDWIRLLICTVLGVVINQLLFFKGLSMTSTISASVIMTSNPIIVLVASYFILKELVTKLKLTGILFGSAGAVLLILHGEIIWEEGSFLGDLFIFLNAASFGMYMVLVKPLMARYKPITIIKWTFLFGSILIIPIGFGEFDKVDWINLPVNAWLSLFYVIVFTTVISYVLNLWALKRVSPTVVSYYIYLQPFFATLVAVLFLEEIIEIKTMVYALMIFIGVFMVSRR